MRRTLLNGKWRKRLKIKALPPFAELHKVRAGNRKMFIVINYIIFSYSENVFISKGLDEKVLTDSAFQEMCYTTNIAVASTPINGQALDAALNSFDLSKRHTVPNLLSKKYALNGDGQLSP